MNQDVSPAAKLPRTSIVREWMLLEFDQVDSTNLVAARLEPWTAVRADTQTAGRGRFQRSWVSDAGGLWLSAVVPVSERQHRQLLPLAAGLSVIESLATFGIRTARLRWPNDIMVNDRKLAGLLVDSFSPDTAVIGVGINISNQPAHHDNSLAATAIRLVDVVHDVPAPRALAEAILNSLRSTIDELQNGGLAQLCPRINGLWGDPRPVRLDLDGVERFGLFTGIDECGRLLLRDEQENVTAFEPHQVRLLREII